MNLRGSGLIVKTINEPTAMANKAAIYKEQK